MQVIFRGLLKPTDALKFETILGFNTMVCYHKDYNAQDLPVSVVSMNNYVNGYKILCK